MIMNLHNTLAQLNQELSTRLHTYVDSIAAGRLTAAEANHKYFCIETCISLLGGPTPHASHIQSPEKVIAELDAWALEITRAASFETRHADTRKIRAIQEAKTIISGGPESSPVEQITLF
jgi:hypothetical protein